MNRTNLVIILVLAAALLLLPLVGNNYVLRLATIMLMYISLALAWNFIGGFAGYPSFGLAAFFGLGAYAGGIVQAQGAPLLLAWIGAIAIGGTFALLLGFVLLRLRGHAFAIATLVITEVVREIVTSWTSLTGGGMGLNLPFSGWGPDAVARFFFYAMFGFAALSLVATALTATHRLGFGLRCIQQNEDAANMVGVNTTLYKTLAFGLSGATAAGAGAIYASWTGYIDPSDVFDVLYSIKPMVMVLLGGLGTVLGPLIGAVVFLALDELVWRSFLQIHTGVLGLLIILLILFVPEGFFSVFRRWPMRKATTA